MPLRRAIVATLILGGLRIGELCALRCAHIDLAHRVIRVIDAKVPAGVRMIDIHDDLLDELAVYKHALGEPWLHYHQTHEPEGHRELDRKRRTSRRIGMHHHGRWRDSEEPDRGRPSRSRSGHSSQATHTFAEHAQLNRLATADTNVPERDSTLTRAIAHRVIRMNPATLTGDTVPVAFGYRRCQLVQG